jgi:hypothetical protein
MAAGRADKTIQVGVAEFDGFSTTYGVLREHTINGVHTVQEAVKEEWVSFPSRCRRVLLRRGGAFVAQALWYMADPEAVWERDLYDTIADGDEFIIVKRAYKPDGPRKEREDGLAPGPLDSRVVSDLLRELSMM